MVTIYVSMEWPMGRILLTVDPGVVVQEGNWDLVGNNIPVSTFVAYRRRVCCLHA